MDVRIASAIIALLGVVISASLSRSIASRSTYINSVTVERSKWIDKLRSNLSDFLGAAAYLYHKVSVDPDPQKKYRLSDEHDGLVRQLETLDALIRLQLNPSGRVDRNIITLLEDIPTLADTTDQRFRTAHNLLIRHSQWLLKDEWEKVKFESRESISGYFSRWYRLWKYLRFCKAEGSIDTLKNTTER